MTDTWEGATLDTAKAWLRKHLDEGAVCPCCNRWARIYRRPLNSGMARSLIMMWRLAGTDWMHLTDLGPMDDRGREETKLAYWGLVEEERTERPDGARDARHRVTPLGAHFVKGEVSVQKYARVYNGGGVSVGLTGPLIDIHDALRDKFDYQELMRG